MTGLILKLAPNERVLINGAVIENGDRRTKIAIRTPNAHILRLKDAIHPDEASSPVARLCYICQLVLSGDADHVEGHLQISLGIRQLSDALTDQNSQSVLQSVAQAISQHDFYKALKCMKLLLPLEKLLLSRGAA